MDLAKKNVEASESVFGRALSFESAVEQAIDADEENIAGSIAIQRAADEIGCRA